ncbi:MAG: cupin domain-containing protein [Candidatus Eremiobacteraeota bacterium]|nr:cupin domain-containing protein [Candidatus Eremiobacteraeota bacterium]
MLFRFVRVFMILGFCLFFGTTNAKAQSSFQFLNIRMKLEVAGAQTKGTSSTLRAEIPAGGGPPAAHVHSREDETYIITRGHFRFWHGNQVVDATPGSVVFLPRNEAHQFANVGSTVGEQILIISPSGFERFFLDVSKHRIVLPRDRAEFMRLSTAYGIRYVAPLMKRPMQR